MKTFNPRNHAGFTWIELLVCLVIVCILSAFALHFVLRPRSHDYFVLAKMKQLHLATQQMALDGETARDTNLGWPGDTGGTFTNWVAALVPAYLGANDLCKLLSAPGRVVPLGKLPERMTDTALLVYAVSKNSASNTVFLTTANFTNTPTGGILTTADPYGKIAFVVFRKGGDGQMIMGDQFGKTNVGSFAPLCR